MMWMLVLGATAVRTVRGASPAAYATSVESISQKKLLMTMRENRWHATAGLLLRDTWPVCFLCLGDGDDDRAFVEDVTLSRRQDFRLSVLRYDLHALLHSEPTPADLKHAD